MKGLLYQLKSVRKDKFCVMSFFLPVMVAVILHFAGSIDLSSLGELQFGVIAGDIALETENWLARYGPVTVCQTKEELIASINDPSTNLIGVEMEGDDIRTVISGDEWAIIRQAAGTLPALYQQRDTAAQVSVQILERPDILAGYQNIFAAMTLVAAMFMGCTFNAMNVISEKEDGIAQINEILPMTSGQYVIQKIFIGFVFGCLSEIVTAAVCFRVSPAGVAAMLALTVLSAFTAALVGLFIGRISDGLMVGVVYIKIVMIVFMAVPLLKYLTATGNKALSFVCYLVPSSAAFEGIMDLANGGMEAAGKDMAILAVHCVGWFLLYLIMSGIRKKS
ncbi:MAG: ABC transporter permease [Lachnospiraceae bacterium]|nr:ABC transporter permease [Lachnospiraceae bacterium]